MSEKGKPNGSVDILAGAMRTVFSELLDESREKTQEDLKGVEERLGKRIDTTNENMQVQFAEQEKKISKVIRENAS